MRIVKIIFILLVLVKCSNNNPYKPVSHEVDYSSIRVKPLKEILDTFRLLNIDSQEVLLPDTFLLVRLYVTPTIFLFDSLGNRLDMNICNAHFPDFYSEVIEKLDELPIAKEPHPIYGNVKEHMTTLKGEMFSGDSEKAYVIVFALPTWSEAWERTKHLPAIRKKIPERIRLLYLVADNFQELHFDKILEMRRRTLLVMEHSDYEPSESIKKQLGIK